MSLFLSWNRIRTQVELYFRLSLVYIYIIIMLIVGRIFVNLVFFFFFFSVLFTYYYLYWEAMCFFWLFNTVTRHHTHTHKHTFTMATIYWWLSFLFSGQSSFRVEWNKIWFVIYRESVFDYLILYFLLKKSKRKKNPF